MSVSHIPLLKRILFVLFVLVIYRIGAYIPLPGIDMFGMLMWLNSSTDVMFVIFNCKPVVN